MHIMDDVSTSMSGFRGCAFHIEQCPAGARNIVAYLLERLQVFAMQLGYVTRCPMAGATCTGSAPIQLGTAVALCSIVLSTPAACLPTLAAPEYSSDLLAAAVSALRASGVTPKRTE